MTDSYDKARDAAKQAVSEDDIREQVKNITLKALSHQQLDKDSIKRVVQAVVEGASDGIGDSSENLKPKLKESLKGIDDALSKSAIALKLAVEETAGRTEKFAKEDLNSAIGELKNLEDNFIDTLNSAAKQASTLTSSVLTELSDHFKQPGTSAGREAIDATKDINDALLRMGAGTINELAEASKTASEQFSNIASGILSGMAEAIKPKSNAKPESDTQSKSQSNEMREDKPD